MKALGDWTIVKYEKEEDFVAGSSGILAPSARNQRMMIKGKTHEIKADPDHNLPDLMRIGEVVTSNKYTVGAHLLFNKHDGYGFEMDGQYLFAIKNDNVMAGFE